ncbi:MAG: S8 family serine peptidase [Chitinophagales bacterium]|nr:S8 family serine peptidase [Chitinophagales bacterium]
MRVLIKFYALSLLLAPALLGAQTDKPAPVKADTFRFYWGEFTDKKGSPYSLDRPEEFLSEKAIARRKKYNIPVSVEDFPPNPAYLAELRAKGANILHTSRWLNAATFTIPGDSLEAVEQLGFLSNVTYMGIQIRGGAKFGRTVDMDSLMSRVEKNYYGHGAQQIAMINGDELHKKGYTGEGVLVAVLDGGFTGVDKSPFFEELRKEGRLLPGFDFVDLDTTVYESSSHGTRVLSTMAAKQPNLLVGTAPDASYICIKTEDVSSEYPLEECHWVAGIEYAESLGADIVTSSLGYTRFDDTLFNHKWEQLNGTTAVASKASAIASKKGLLVLNSAGNEGSSNWRYIGIPADVASTLSVGAITLDGNLASFSSVGPTADERIKPDVVAPGARVALADAYSYKVSRGSGTSFSTPMVAGMVACLFQAFPNKSSEDIFDAIRRSSSLYRNPDNESGYGTPDFMKAYNLLRKDQKGIEKRPEPATSGDEDH